MPFKSENRSEISLDYSFDRIEKCEFDDCKVCVSCFAGEFALNSRIPFSSACLPTGSLTSDRLRGEVKFDNCRVCVSCFAGKLALNSRVPFSSACLPTGLLASHRLRGEEADKEKNLSRCR